MGMARAIWSGSVSFGLVNVPVKVYSAVRDHKVHFHQVDKGSGSRIRYEKVAEKTGQEVSADQIELGYEMEKGRLVVVDPAELDELRPQTTRTIDISDFVDLSEIDPAYYQRTYWLAPDGEGAARAYRLLQAAMEESEKVGIGSVVMRNKQYLAAIRPRDGALAMSTKRFADENVAKSDIDPMPPRTTKPDAKELRLATQIVDSLSGAWKPETYRDTYTEEVRKLVEAHEPGQDVVVEEAPAERTALVVDLMDVLQASLDEAKSRKGRPKAPAKKKTASRQPVKKQASKSSTRRASTSRKSA